MKKIRILLSLFVLYSISLTSCSSDDSNPVNNPPVNTPTFTATIAGEAFIATQATAVQEGDNITITGIRADNGEKIELVAHRTSPGTSGSTSLKYYPEEGNDSYDNYHLLQMDFNGYVTLLSVDAEKVSGTFAFTGYLNSAGAEGIQITNGQFSNVPLTILSGTQTNTESLFAIVDGEEDFFSHINVANTSGIVIISGLEAMVMHSINITLPQNIVTGTHTIGNNTTANFINISGALQFQSVSGTLTITNNSNGWLTGSFSFTGQDGEGSTHQVTAGHFHVAVD